MNDFKQLLLRVQVERERTNNGRIEETLAVKLGIENPEEETVESVSENTLETVNKNLLNLEIELKEGMENLDPQERRELRGILNMGLQQRQTPEDQIRLLEETELPYWESKLREENAEENRANTIQKITRYIGQKADHIRIRIK